MTTLQHIVEPTRWLMIWQPLDSYAPSRTRRVIGERCQGSDDQTVFRYLKTPPILRQPVN